MLAPMRLDVHQHIWTAPLIDALTMRSELPFIRLRGGIAELHAAGERPCAIDLNSQTASSRTRLLDDDRIELAVIALSSPIGIEALPRDEALTVIAAHLDGVRALGHRFAAWGPVPLDHPDLHDVDEVLARGCIGVSMPAGALATPRDLDAAAPLLDRIAQRDVPLFVHPGPGLRAAGDGQEAPADEPPWWQALNGYVAQMQSAWLAFATVGRSRHPELTVVFSMLAGGAPLLSERLDTRRGPRVDLGDPLTYYDTSSYGPTAIEAMARRVGSSQLVYGSDRPVLEPLASGREAILQAAAADLLAPTRLAA
jgi:predicted TIM-barrel fold metal-dependent hydrolase